MTDIAHENCRLGRQQELTPAGHAKAKEYFEIAKASDPRHLPTFAEYSNVLVHEYQNGWGPDRAAALAEARRHADIAVELSKDASHVWHNDIRGLWYSAMVSWNEGNFDKSFEEYKAARTLIKPERQIKDSSDVDADQGEALVYAGDPEGAVALIEAAIARNPDHPYWYLWNLARAHYAAHNYQEALDAIDRIASPPNDVRLIDAASHAQLGQLDDARTIMEEFSARDPDWTLAKSADYHYKRDADRQHWLDGLRMAGLRAA